MCRMQPWNVLCRGCHQAIVDQWEEVASACPTLVAHRKAECLKEGKKWKSSLPTTRYDNTYGFYVECVTTRNESRDLVLKEGDHRWPTFCPNCARKEAEEQKSRRKHREANQSEEQKLRRKASHNEASKRSKLRKKAEIEVTRRRALDAHIHVQNISQTFSTGELQASISAVYQDDPRRLSDISASTASRMPSSDSTASSQTMSSLETYELNRRAGLMLPPPPPRQPAYQQPASGLAQLLPLQDVLRTPFLQHATFVSDASAQDMALQAGAHRPGRFRHPDALPVRHGRFINPGEGGYHHPLAIFIRGRGWVSPGEDGWHHPQAIAVRGGGWINPGEEGYEDAGPPAQSDYGDY